MSKLQNRQTSQNNGKTGPTILINQRRCSNAIIHNNQLKTTNQISRRMLHSEAWLTFVASSVFVYIVAGSTEFDTLRRNSVDSSGCARKSRCNAKNRSMAAAYGRLLYWKIPSARKERIGPLQQSPNTYSTLVKMTCLRSTGLILQSCSY